jgi:hypothetical protein
VHALTTDDDGTTEFVFGTPITDATKIRLTFHGLTNSGLGPFPYRAGVRDVHVLTGSSVSTTVDGGTHREGNYGDYTDIVKLMLAYGGFYWPSTRRLARFKKSDGTYEINVPSTSDPYLGSGRVWGDIEETRTTGIVPLPPDMFDKKPLMDIINGIRDIVAFIFFVDETGGAVFRSPNFWQIGNYLSDLSGGARTGRTTNVLTLDERTVLIGVEARLSSANVRERVFVANSTGKYGALAAGFNPYPSGMRRVAGWTDQHFRSKKECQIMADLITVRQMFTYRTDRVTIAGYPGIQIDDQVRIFERVTNEGYLHYISGIECDWNLEDGKWIYTLDTQWLGTVPFAQWAVNPAKLSAETQQYLKTINKVP